MSTLTGPITIEPCENHDVLVRYGDRFALLTRDESLWAVATCLMGQPSAWLRTYEEASKLPWFTNVEIAGLLDYDRCYEHWPRCNCGAVPW